MGQLTYRGAGAWPEEMALPDCETDARLLRTVGQLTYFDVLWDRGVAGGDGSAGPGGPEGQPDARHLALCADLRRLPTPLLRHHRHQQRRQRPAGYVTHTLSHMQGTSLTHSATSNVVG